MTVYKTENYQNIELLDFSIDEIAQSCVLGAKSSYRKGVCEIIVIIEYRYYTR